MPIHTACALCDSCVETQSFEFGQQIAFANMEMFGLVWSGLIWFRFVWLKEGIMMWYRALNSL